MRGLRHSPDLLSGSEGYSPTPLSCGFGEQQSAHGDTLNQPFGPLVVYDKKNCKDKVIRVCLEY